MITKGIRGAITVDENYILPQKLTRGEFVAIHPGVSKMSIRKNILKCPNLDFWKNLITELLEKGEKVVLFGTRDDEDLISKIIADEKISSNQNFINYFNKIVLTCYIRITFTVKKECRKIKLQIPFSFDCNFNTCV